MHQYNSHRLNPHNLEGGEQARQLQRYFQDDAQGVPPDII